MHNYPHHILFDIYLFIYGTLSVISPFSIFKDVDSKKIKSRETLPCDGPMVCRSVRQQLRLEPGRSLRGVPGQPFQQHPGRQVSSLMKTIISVHLLAYPDIPKPFFFVPDFIFYFFVIQYSGFLIRFDLLRIRIKYFFSNCRASAGSGAFDDHLSLARKGRPSYAFSLHKSPAHLNMKLHFFLFLWFTFALLDPDPHFECGSGDSNEFGSGSENIVDLHRVALSLSCFILEKASSASKHQIFSSPFLGSVANPGS
jgi:hypothetical protein